jgi:hypothetical protein
MTELARIGAKYHNYLSPILRRNCSEVSELRRRLVSSQNAVDVAEICSEKKEELLPPEIISSDESAEGVVRMLRQ